MPRSNARSLTVLVSIALVAVLLIGTPGAQPKSDGKVHVGHGFSMFGDLKYPTGFKHFGYANPNAPKGGDVKLAAIGTYDNLNPFILKGVPAAGLSETFETLMVGSLDE